VCPPGDRVDYLGKNTDRPLELIFGAAMARATCVVLNWRLAMPEWRDIVDVLDAADRDPLGVATVATGAAFADRVNLSVPTVKWHFYKLFTKLQVNNRAAALFKARSLSLLR
jgi:hypothetical protein